MIPLDNERVAKVETAMESISKGLNRLEDKLDALLDTLEKKFMPRAEHAETVKRLEQRLDEHEASLAEVRDKVGRLPAWASALIAFLVTVLGALIPHVIRK